jgi:orotate phosphoribosyltransferase
MATPADLVRRGHFGYESGHHGDIWLELDLLVSQPKRMRALAQELAGRLAGFGADLVCGPLEGGAFLAQWVAAALDTGFVYTARAANADGPPGYALPGGTVVDGHKAVVVDDAINLGMATNATVAALRGAGCDVVALGSVLVCTPGGAEVGRRLGVPQVWLAEVSIKVWEPADCPLCRAGGVPAATPM